MDKKLRIKIYYLTLIVKWILQQAYYLKFQTGDQPEKAEDNGQNNAPKK